MNLTELKEKALAAEAALIKYGENPSVLTAAKHEKALHYFRKEASTDTILELCEALESAREMAEYYAHPDHYEETIRIGGTRPPSVLIERGNKARDWLAKYGKGES